MLILAASAPANFSALLISASMSIRISMRSASPFFTAPMPVMKPASTAEDISGAGLMVSRESSSTSETESTTAPTTGDPLGATNVTGWHMKNDGTRNKRLVGVAQSDAAGVFWRAGARGVYMSGISSYYQKQRLNYHLHVTGGNSQTVYTEINSNQYLQAMADGLLDAAKVPVIVDEWGDTPTSGKK